MMIHHIHGVGFSGKIFLLDAEKTCLIDTGWGPDITHTETSVEDGASDHLALSLKYIKVMGRFG